MVVLCCSRTLACMPHRARTLDEQAGSQAGLVLLYSRVRASPRTVVWTAGLVSFTAKASGSYLDLLALHALRALTLL